MTLENEIIGNSKNVEVTAKKPRRRFTADEKRRIVQAAEVCTKPGELTALLRREGIYWTYLSNWRRDFKKNNLAPVRRGPKAATQAEKDAKARVKTLERELERMKMRAELAEALVDLQKKVTAALNGLPSVER